DLKDRSMLGNTLVVALGEFGRTPQLNPRGGRDHWPGVWSVLFAGGRGRGGQGGRPSHRTGPGAEEPPASPRAAGRHGLQGAGHRPQLAPAGARGPAHAPDRGRARQRAVPGVTPLAAFTRENP